ncbi:MAG: DUF4230 domain-containing protein [Lachnospiraceae bacterium]|nr:DUF4230 domain-containing protein [Lachnospiraceae bacterium]
MEKEKHGEWKNKLILIMLLIIVVMITIAVLVIRHAYKQRESIADKVEESVIGEEGKVTTNIDARLEEVVRSGRLYTAEYPYNGYVAVTDDEGAAKYYVAYEGTVKAGIDNIQDIKLKVDKDSKTITIRLPEVKVYPPEVNAGTLEYIFVDEKYNTETVASEAFEKASEDIRTKVENDNEFKMAATETVKTAEKAIIKPWLNLVEEGETYTVIILAYGEEADGDEK